MKTNYKLLRKIREDNNLNLEHLSIILGISISTLSQLERGYKLNILNATKREKVNNYIRKNK